MATATERLLYYFWLPSGKDEFGFSQYRDAPFHATTFYRRKLERTIADHFAERADRLRDGNKLAFMTPSGAPTPVTGELGMRKIHLPFSYRSNHAGIEELTGGAQVDGTVIVMSNGLYLWAFDIPKPADRTASELKGLFLDFLATDFVERHIRQLFDFGWNAATADSDPDKYAGVMTYFQLDLLFNGVFDQAGHPHLFLTGNRLADDGSRDRTESVQRAYDVQHLIRALSMCGYDRDYFPLYDQRKNYALNRTYGDEFAYINASMSLMEPRLAASDEDNLHRREMLLSRLAFAGMEQFVRVSTSFGLPLYRTGLDHVRAELTSQSIEARQNRPSGELRRPSLRTLALTLPDLEAYHALLAGKLPRLRFLEDLIVDLTESGGPTREPKENGVEGAVEWHYAKESLLGARSQLTRQIDGIAADLRAIDSSLASARQELMIAELTEARKLSEIEAETPRNAVLRNIQWGRLTARLGVFAAIIGGAQVFSALGLWVTDKAPAPLAIGVWAVGLALFVWLIVHFGKPRNWGLDTDEDTRDSDQIETHVFDYAAISRPIRAADGASGVVQRIRERMTDLENVDHTVGCANYSTFREMPSSGVERVKHSLESASTSNDLSYILHIEVDRRLGADRAERLVGVRLVARKVPGADLPELEQNAVHVIATCIQAMIFREVGEGEIRAYFKNRFGWDWPPT